MKPETRLLNLKDTAAYLGISENAVNELFQEQDIQTITIGKSKYTTVYAIGVWLEQAGLYMQPDYSLVNMGKE